jgi:hypothetical protein
MLPLVAIVLIVLLALVLGLVLALIVSLAIVAIGWVLSSVFPLSLFEGTIVALVTSIGIGYALYRFVEGVPLVSDALDEDWEDGEDWLDEEDDEPEPPIVPWRQRRPTQAAAQPRRKRKKRGR